MALSERAPLLRNATFEPPQLFVTSPSPKNEPELDDVFAQSESGSESDDGDDASSDGYSASSNSDAGELEPEEEHELQVAGFVTEQATNSTPPLNSIRPYGSILRASLPQLGVSSKASKRRDDGYLANTGNVARDHMSNERTFLAYVRTAAAFASAGVAFSKFFATSLERPHPNPRDTTTISAFSHYVGGSLVLLSTIMLCLALDRYFSIQTTLQDGQFRPARGHVYVVDAWIGSVIMFIAVIIIVFPR